ncbi:membrane dipeptidase, partial [Streptosporangium sp. NPDC049644]|uniref:dipeptidase n=1 Tax=Streptosporangium sp. NPDC049644 TaxID=3155507 RepID=UPI00342818A4
SARALRDHHRNLTDEQIRAVAATGGVVCVNFVPSFLSADPAEFTVDRLVDHIEHIARVGGIDHVGLGPDFVREVLTDVTPPCCEDLGYGEIAPLAVLPGLSGPSGLPLVTEALAGRGIQEEDILKILGGNVLRLFRAELGRPR